MADTGTVIQFALFHNCVYVSRQSLMQWMDRQIQNPLDGVSEEHQEGMRNAFLLLRGKLADLDPNTATEKAVQ